jgi:hypothetical protein
VPPGTDPTAAFRTALTKLITRRLRECGIPALWVAVTENSQGWGDHVHIALHIPVDRQAELVPVLDAAIRARFRWDGEAIAVENRTRIQLARHDLVFNPVNIRPADQLPGGEGFTDYITKGAHDPRGDFTATVLTISHKLAALSAQWSAQTAHITADALHRRFAQEKRQERVTADAEAVVNALKRRRRKLHPSPKD